MFEDMPDADLIDPTDVGRKEEDEDEDKLAGQLTISKVCISPTLLNVKSSSILVLLSDAFKCMYHHYCSALYILLFQLYQYLNQIGYQIFFQSFYRAAYFCRNNFS